MFAREVAAALREMRRVEAEEAKLREKEQLALQKEMETAEASETLEEISSISDQVALFSSIVDRCLYLAVFAGQRGVHPAQSGRREPRARKRGRNSRGHQLGAPAQCQTPGDVRESVRRGIGVHERGERRPGQLVRVSVRHSQRRQQERGPRRDREPNDELGNEFRSGAQHAIRVAAVRFDVIIAFRGWIRTSGR